MMMAQYIIAFLLIALAVLYAVLRVRSRMRDYNGKGECGSNCGCSGSAKELILRD